MVRASTPAPRSRRVRESTIWLALVVAVGVHGTVFAAAEALGLSIGGSRRLARSTHPRPAPEDVELTSTCTGNAALATSGRAAMCFAPWVNDVDDCLSLAQMSLWIDLSGCQARNDPRTAISIIENKTADRLAEIDPERLLEERKPEPKPVQPPKLPQPVPQAAPPPPPPPAAPPPPAPKPQQQVVETIKPKEEQKEPENTRFLSENNINVEKQKVSRGARNEPMVAKAKPEALTPKDKPKDEPSIKQAEPDRVIGKNEKAPDNPGLLSMRNPGALSPALDEQAAKRRGTASGVTGVAANDGYQARKGDAALEQQRRDRSEIPRGQNGAGGGAPPPNLKLSQEVLERTAGGGSVDHLEDVENGDETLLSSKRWIYAEFFNRVKRQVAQNWSPEGVLRRRDPTGTVFGSKTRVTEVRVSLSRRGELTKVVVIGPSGVVELDEEARRAFQAAGPFPNPPEGLVAKDNMITFAFSFFLEMGAPRLSWRLPAAM